MNSGSDSFSVSGAVKTTALAKNPRDRYDSARELGEALRQARLVLCPGAPLSAAPMDPRPPVLPAAPATGRTEATIPPLIEALKDEDVEVRRASAVALGELGSAARNAVPGLLGMMLEDKDPGASAAATEALKHIIGGPEHAQTPVPAPTKPRPSVSIMMEQLVSADAAARWRAVLGLGEMGPHAQEAVPAVLVLLDDPDTVVRASAIKALAKIGAANLEVVSRLARLLQDEDPLVSREAAVALDSLSLFRNHDSNRAAG